jgi:hypothetical protein
VKGERLKVKGGRWKVKWLKVSEHRYHHRYRLSYRFPFSPFTFQFSVFSLKKRLVKVVTPWQSAYLS